MRLLERIPLRIAQIAAIAALAVMTLGAGDNAVPYNTLGHKMMCVCSCNQVLIECNHVGCPYSEGELQELRAAISHGDSDTTILEAFQQKYGPTVLAAPMLTKFNVVAWIVPFAVLLVGLGATALIVRKWKLRTVEMPAPSRVPQFDLVRDRIRRETEL